LAQWISQGRGMLRGERKLVLDDGTRIFSRLRCEDGVSLQVE
jgi:hypothetical protein